MTFKRVLCASTLAAGVGVAGLLGVGLGTASADPGPQCNAPGDRHAGRTTHGNRGPGDNGGRATTGHGPGGPGPGRLARPRHRPGPPGSPAVQLERPAGHPDAGQGNGAAGDSGSSACGFRCRPPRGGGSPCRWPVVASNGQIGHGVAHPLPRRAHRRDVGAGPQHLARHRGQQRSPAPHRPGPAARRGDRPARRRPARAPARRARRGRAPRTASRRPRRRRNPFRTRGSRPRRRRRSTGRRCDRPASARCTLAPSGLDVAASTNTPRPCSAAVSSSGRSDPKPR